MTERPVVVLLEDDRDMARMVQAVVEEMDSADVVLAEDVDDALALIKDSNPALLIVDDDSPSDGIRGVMHSLGADPEKQFIPVVALTFDPGRVLNLAHLGTIACLKKPFDAVNLVDLVEFDTQPLGSTRSDEQEAA